MSKLASKVAEQGIELASKSAETFPISGPSQSSSRDTSPSQNQLLTLEGIWADGLAEQLEPGRWLIPWPRLLDIDDADARVLELPRAEEVHASLTARGIPTANDFALELSVRHDRYGVLALSARRGPCIVIDNNDVVLLPRQVHELLREVEAAPAADGQTSDRLLYVARCKKAAVLAGAHLDAFLQAQEIELPGAVGVDASELPDGGVVVSPVVGSLAGSDVMLGNGLAREVINVRDGAGHSRRVVLDKETRSRAEGVSRVGKLSGSRVPEFLSNPESFLPDGVDLSQFSERVQGFKVRVYNSRPYVHVRKNPIGWFDFDANVSLDDTGATGGNSARPRATRPRLSPEEYEALAQQARDSGSRWVQHGDDWIEIDPDAEGRFRETVRKLQREQSDRGGMRASVVLDVISNVEVLGFTLDCPELAQNARPWMEGLPECVPPPTFRGELDQHQLLGFRWLSYLEKRAAGGLLADDMGLGKTAQVIAHLCAREATDQLKPSLVVVPKTLVQNWLRELRTFAPELTDIVVHEGPNRPRDTKYLASHALTITTYDTVRQDQVGLGVIDWKAVAIDEAQFIKNPTAGRTSAVKALKCKQIVAMTGTPVENGLIEFWSIMDRVHPGLLGGWSDFRTEFERPLSSASDSQRRKLVSALLDKLDPHYLRRVKAEVLRDLPPKEVQPGPSVELGPLQHELYSNAIDEMREGGRGAALVAIGKLLRICAHPRTVLSGWEQLDSQQLIDECPKLRATIDLLEKIRSHGQKAVIFAEWKSTQRILQRTISHAFGSWPEVINGDVTDRRQQLVDAFCRKPGFEAIILSPKVAGFGLNIVEANHVIHYTRPWNPAIENQATDRVHRRGQTQTVHVYYPTVTGGVEEALATLLDQKLELARDVLRPSAERTVSADDLYDRIAHE